MSEIATVILQFFGLIGIGFGATRLMRLPAQGVSGLNLFIYYFAMPAWFFHLVATTPIRDIEHWSFLIATTFATYCAFAIAFSTIATNSGGASGQTFRRSSCSLLAARKIVFRRDSPSIGGTPDRISNRIAPKENTSESGEIFSCWPRACSGAR